MAVGLSVYVNQGIGGSYSSPLLTGHSLPSPISTLFIRSSGGTKKHEWKSLKKSKLKPSISPSCSSHRYKAGNVFHFQECCKKNESLVYSMGSNGTAAGYVNPLPRCNHVDQTNARPLQRLLLVFQDQAEPRYPHVRIVYQVTVQEFSAFLCEC